MALVIEVNPQLGMDVEEFCKKYMGVVRQACYKFYKFLHGGVIDKDDLESVGYMQLVKIYSKYDHDKASEHESQLKSYIYRSVQGTIMNLFRDHGSSITFPRSVKEALTKINKAGIIDLPPQDIAEQLGMNIDLVEEALIFNSARYTVSADVPLDDEGGESSTLFELLPAPQEYDMEKEMILKDFFKRLTADHKTILTYRLAGYTQRQIAQKCGVSQMGVSRTLEKIFEQATKYGVKIGTNILEPDADEPKEVKKDMSRTPAPHIERAKELLKATTMTYKQISDETGCSYQTVLNWGKKLRVEETITKARKGSSHGDTITRSMTPEEMERYGVNPKGEEPTVEHTSEYTTITVPVGEDGVSMTATFPAQETPRWQEPHREPPLPKQAITLPALRDMTLRLQQDNIPAGELVQYFGQLVEYITSIHKGDTFNIDINITTKKGEK